jgi:hypothetical protein
LSNSLHIHGNKNSFRAEMKAAEAAELAKAEAELKAEAKTSDATAPADTTILI